MSKQRDLFSDYSSKPVARPTMTPLPDTVNFNGSGEPRTPPTSTASSPLLRVEDLPQPTMRPMDKGPMVEVLQKALLQIGVLSSKDQEAERAYYGPHTEEAIKRLERRAFLNETGQYDSMTLRALEKQIRSTGAPVPIVPVKPALAPVAKAEPVKSAPVRKTSIHAYKAIVEEGVLSRMQKKVYAKLYESGPMTANEVNRACLEEGQVTPGYHKRLSELERMGVVTRVGIRACKVTGRECDTWDVTDSMPSKPKPPMQRTHTIYAVGTTEVGVVRTFCDVIGWKPVVDSMQILTKLPSGLTWGRTFLDEVTQQEVTVGGCEVPGGFTLTFMK